MRDRFLTEIEEFIKENAAGLRVVPVSMELAQDVERVAALLKEADSEKNRVFLYEDRWNFGRDQIKQRILLRAGNFKSVFARNCKVLSNIGRSEKEFLNAAMVSKTKKFIETNHSLGYVKSPYILTLIHKENIVAAATFSKPIVTTRIIEGRGRKFLSYEWTRYASLPDVSVVGGMGKLLKAFLEQIKSEGVAKKVKDEAAEKGRMLPIEIMSYSDNEWSGGEAYKKLGFKEVEGKGPIAHYVDTKTWERVSERIAEENTKKARAAQKAVPQYVKIYNMGSRKWLLRFLADDSASDSCYYDARDRG